MEAIQLAKVEEGKLDDFKERLQNSVNSVIYHLQTIQKIEKTLKEME